MTLKLKQLALAAALALLPLTGAEAADWVKLGTKKVNHLGDRDVIPVTGLRGTFRSVKLKVSQRGVRIASLKIHFGNGETQDVNLRRDFPAGSESRVIDLPGGARVIKKIDLVYKTKGKPRGPRAIVEVFGIRTAAAAPKPVAPVEWVALATRKINFGKEKDIIPVTGVQGKFRAIQLRFQKRKVRINDLKVFFGNGEAFDVSVKKEFEPGQWTRIIDLPGGGRTINRIEMVYRTKGLPLGAKGTVEVRGIRVKGSGVTAPAPKPPVVANRAWKKLGSRQVRPRLEKDVIAVTGLAGTFKRVKLVVRKKDVFLVSAKINFANGESHLITINQRVAKGSETAPADLPGAARIIKSVALVYRTKGRGQATVELWGK